MYNFRGFSRKSPFRPPKGGVYKNDIDTSVLIIKGAGNRAVRIKDNVDLFGQIIIIPKQPHSPSKTNRGHKEEIMETRLFDRGKGRLILCLVSDKTRMLILLNFRM